MKSFIQKCGALLVLAGLVGLTACGQKHDQDDGHGHAPKTAKAEEAADDHGSESGASYEEGKGIRLPEETKKSIGLELIDAGEQLVHPTVKLTAQVYRLSSEASRTHGQERKGNAYASALISKETATELKPGQALNFVAKDSKHTGGRGVVSRVVTTQLATMGKAEALLELPDPGNALFVGEFVEAEVPIGKNPKKLLSIPNSAVLTTSGGTFAYVLNGQNLLRTEIKTGVKNDDFTEVTEGLYEGDTIAVKPVEALYLIELRATKGGGHSH